MESTILEDAVFYVAEGLQRTWNIQYNYRYFIDNTKQKFEITVWKCLAK